MTRFGIGAIVCLATTAIAFSAFVHPAPKLIWNASASVPIGLYSVHAAGAFYVGELVVVEPPELLSNFLADRAYLPKGAPLLKHILALPGQTVCRTGRTITVDGAAVGDALQRDRRGRRMPVWRGCTTVRAGNVFLMNPQSTDSVDGRYFGVLPSAAIIGRARPLWIKGAH